MGPVSKLVLAFVALFTSFIILDLSQTEARGPSVEPMAAIAIDQYRPADPQKIQGFDFSNPAPEVLINQSADHKIMDIPVSAQTPKQTLLFIGIVMVLLPLTIWVGIMKNLKGDDSKLLEKVEKLPVKNKQKSSDQDSYPKAS